MPLEFLVGNLLILGFFGNCLKITVYVADPLVRVSFALLYNFLFVLRKSSLLFQTILSGDSSLFIDSVSSLSNKFGIGVKTIKGLGVVKRVVFLDGVKDSI